MTRVLMVCDGLDNGGAERQMALLASNLPAHYEVRVVSLGDGPYADVLRGRGIGLRVVPRGWRYDVSPGWRIWREMVLWRPDLVHSWGWMAGAAAAVSCKVLRIPLVDGTIRSARLPDRWRRTARFLLSRADAVIANSEAGLAAYGVSGPRAFVVHNGFEAERKPARPGESTGTTNDIPEVVMAARMVPAKDFDTLLDAAERVRDSGHRFRLTLVGSGPESERLTARAQDLIGAGVVRILDGGLEVMPVLASADIGVLLTDPRYHAEGLSNSIMEYMACGLPVVCTDSGGNREVVLDGHTGFVVPPHDAAAVADALGRLLDEPDTALRFGETGRERISTVFSAEAMVENTVRVYETVLRAGL